ncbi:MAG: sodium/proton-translocating pyrophosphatase, partial [Ilumatobacteraceae bacterium]
MSGLFAAEGGYQEFVLKGGEWAVLWLSAAAAVLAIAVGFYLARLVMAADEGTPKMKEIALAIQEGALAYLKRQFKTIIMILVPLAVIVFVTSKAISHETASGAIVHDLSFGQAGLWRTLAFILGCAASGFTGYIGMTLATRGNVRTAAAALTGSMPDALTVAFRTGGVAGMFTVGLGLSGATAIIMLFQNTSSVILVGFGFGGSLLALFLRVGGGIFTKAADVGADLVGKVEAGIPEDDPRNPATIADNVGDNVGDCAGMAADLFESYEVTLVASIILGVAAFKSIGLNPAMGLVFPLAARAIGVIASIFGVFAVKAKPDETDALKPINKGFLVAGTLTLVGTLALALKYVGNTKATAASMAHFFSADDIKKISPMGGAGWRVFGAVAVGLVLAQLVSRLTEYYTATHHGPVQEIAESAETG